MPKRPTTQSIAIHYTASAGVDFTADDIDAMHKKRGWNGMAYHELIRRFGDVQYGRPIGDQGAHAYPYNLASYAICLNGGPVYAKDGSILKRNDFTREQWETLKQRVELALVKFPGAEVLGHTDYPGEKTLCPGFDVITWARENGFPVPGL